MHAMKCLLDHELLCVVGIYELHLKCEALLMHHGCVHWVCHERREYSVSTATAAVSARRE